MKFIELWENHCGFVICYNTLSWSTFTDNNNNNNSPPSSLFVYGGISSYSIHNRKSNTGLNYAKYILDEHEILSAKKCVELFARSIILMF